jgi:hypothetical protein
MISKDIWKVTGQEDANLGIRKRKFGWIEKYALQWNPQGSRKRG